MFRTRDTDANGTLDETLYALHDANWNITALADTSGAIVERFAYDPYGKSTVLDAAFTDDSDNTSDYAWEYRFTSREFDPETNLHYFRARYYHDGLGRFTRRDPLLYVDGTCLYGAYFVPSALDPFGHSLWSPPRPCCRPHFINPDVLNAPIWDCSSCPGEAPPSQSC
ncbi:MAG: RHS repeat-associated core domain-containing protein, partial [Planctomycetaceae bacterium]